MKDKNFKMYSPTVSGICAIMAEDPDGRWMDGNDVKAYIDELEKKVPVWHDLAVDKPEYGKYVIVKTTKGSIAEAMLCKHPGQDEVWIENGLLRGTIIKWTEKI